MPPTPPSFGSQEYWDKRFTSNSNPFEWLEAPTALDPYLVEALKDSKHPGPELLHIGCGTSLLSYHLRAHVKNPERIHNLDYSEVAIDVGRKREIEIFGAEPELFENKNVKRILPNEAEMKDDSSLGDVKDDTAKPPEEVPNRLTKSSYMRWLAADLLSPSSLFKACKPSTYSIIVDKSTSDSIACSDDIHVPLPYHVTTSPTSTSTASITESSEPIHPIHIMAIHLALLAKPKGRWISLSYSVDRYPFLQIAPRTSSGPNEASALSHASSPEEMTTAGPDDSGDDISLDGDLDNIPQKVIDSGLPDPGALWTLIEKYEIEVPEPETSGGNTTIHRPKVMHWVYVLERTDVPLFVREP